MYVFKLLHAKTQNLVTKHKVVKKLKISKHVIFCPNLKVSWFVLIKHAFWLIQFNVIIKKKIQNNFNEKKCIQKK